MTRRIKYSLKVDDKVIEEKQTRQVRVFGYDNVLTDEVLIEYYQFYLKELIQRNKLLGTFDDDAQYNIPENLKKELVKLEKEIADENESYYILLTVYMKKTFNFALEIEELGDGNATATLYLNESIEGNSAIHSLKTFIAQVKLPYDNLFHEKVQTIFHMVRGLPSIKEQDIGNLAVYMQKLYNAENYDDDGIEDLGSQIYIMRMLKTLEKAGKEGQEIVKQFKEEASERKLNPKEKGTNIKLRKILDEVIFDNGGIEKLELPKEELLAPMKELIGALNKVDEVKKINAKAEKDAEKAKIAGGGTKKAGGESSSSDSKRNDKQKPKAKAKGGGSAKKDKKKDKKDKDKKDEKKKSSGSGNLGWDFDKYFDEITKGEEDDSSEVATRTIETPALVVREIPDSSETASETTHEDDELTPEELAAIEEAERELLQAATKDAELQMKQEVQDAADDDAKNQIENEMQDAANGDAELQMKQEVQDAADTNAERQIMADMNAAAKEYSEENE